jgi:hypothetical protein
MSKGLIETTNEIRNLAHGKNDLKYVGSNFNY